MTPKCRENPSQRSLSRLATVRRFAALLLALALGAGAALALASCGGGEDAKLLPGHTATEITENLDRVKQYAEEDECVGAEDAVAEVNNQIEGLTNVDSKLVEALQHGAARLEEVVAGCEEDETETVSPSSEESSTEEGEEEEKGEKIPPGQEKKAEKEREKEEAALEREEEKAEKHPPDEGTPHQPSPPPPTPPGEAGGTGAPGGVSPGEAVEGDQGGD